MTISSLSKRLTLAGLGALGLAVTAPSMPAHAQPYDDYQRYGSDAGVVTVYSPRRFERDSTTGAPIDLVRESRPVYYGDLNLSTGWGIRAFHARVVRAATELCNDIDMQPGRVPLNSNQVDCVRPAVEEAMASAPIPDGMRYRYENVRYGY
ncbi:MAG TPA: UrcA family protein [Caulobacteraceae bacterium]|nr:UrcA family protein [Caulobacteraceae bacterium]